MNFNKTNKEEMTESVKTQESEKSNEPVTDDSLNIADYTEKSNLQLACRRVVLAENTNIKSTLYGNFLVAEIKWDNLLGINEYYNAAVTTDYLEAVREFIKRETGLLELLESERNMTNLPFHKLTAADCISNSINADFEGKAVIIKPEILASEYRSAEYQYGIVTGGFGANPDSRGRAVFVKTLYDGKESRFNRSDIAGLADLSKMPAWAVDKLAEYAKPKEANIITGATLNIA